MTSPGPGPAPPAPPQKPAGWPDGQAPWVGNGYDAWWEDTVTKSNWTSRTVGSGYVDWYKLLPCPRCSHQMSVLVAPGAYRDATGAVGRSGMVTASCNCAEKHAGRPDTRPGGCGFGAWVPGPPKGSAE